jgi:hypothetical protein
MKKGLCMGRWKRFLARTSILAVLGLAGFATSLVFATVVLATDSTETTTTETTTTETTTTTTTTTPGSNGCTPGYWKNHLDSWGPTGYSPDDTLASVFNPAVLGSLGSDTLLEALSYAGGPGVDGAKRILLRAAVASVLNASHPDVDFGPSAAVVIGATNFALASNVREGILDIASQLDARNNAGCFLS